MLPLISMGLPGGKLRPNSIENGRLMREYHKAPALISAEPKMCRQLLLIKHFQTPRFECSFLHHPPPSPPPFPIHSSSSTISIGAHHHQCRHQSTIFNSIGRRRIQLIQIRGVRRKTRALDEEEKEEEEKEEKTTTRKSKKEKGEEDEGKTENLDESDAKLHKFRAELLARVGKQWTLIPMIGQKRANFIAEFNKEMAGQGYRVEWKNFRIFDIDRWTQDEKNFLLLDSIMVLVLFYIGWLIADKTQAANQAEGPLVSVEQFLQYVEGGKVASVAFKPHLNKAIAQLRSRGENLGHQPILCVKLGPQYFNNSELFLKQIREAQNELDIGETVAITIVPPKIESAAPAAFMLIIALWIFRHIRFIRFVNRMHLRIVPDRGEGTKRT